MRIHRSLTAALLVLTAVLGAISNLGPAYASQRVTKGEAEAVLRAFGSGGMAVLNHNQVVQAGPGDLRAQLSPLNPEGCALDWHAIKVLDVEGSSTDKLGERTAAATISQLSMSIQVDGTSLKLTQTPVSRFLDPQLLGAGTVAAYSTDWGALFAPGALSIGTHLERVVLSVAGVGPVVDVTFPITIDPAGTGACLA